MEIIELRDHAHDLTNNLLTGFPTESLRKVLDTVVAADALIAVTPTFSASYNGLFKMFFDVIDDKALAGKPVLLAATGGTERHSLVLDFAFARFSLTYGRIRSPPACTPPPPTGVREPPSSTPASNEPPTNWSAP